MQPCASLALLLSESVQPKDMNPTPGEACSVNSPAASAQTRLAPQPVAKVMIYVRQNFTTAARLLTSGGFSCLSKAGAVRFGTHFRSLFSCCSLHQNPLGKRGVRARYTFQFSQGTLHSQGNLQHILQPSHTRGNRHTRGERSRELILCVCFKRKPLNKHDEDDRARIERHSESNKKKKKKETPING